MSEARDYKDTVFLPKTEFPMKAGLPQKEPGIAARWEQDRLYDQLRTARDGAEKFILHDGPPYANGDMHIGHALNHVIKDMVCRTQSALGKDAPYVPGWDCHGLPIEWKVEELYRKQKRDKKDVPPAEFRAECREYAARWVDVQREQLKRLGIMGDWDNPYLTMQFDSEATIVAELMKFAESGNLYRGSKPVMWSPVEETALAEAEVEYEDIVSTQIDVAFEIVESPIPELVGAHAVIWTTTPWTIPVNQAIAYGPDVEYSLYRIEPWYDLDGCDSEAFTTALKRVFPLDCAKILIARILVSEYHRRLQTMFEGLSVPGFEEVQFLSLVLDEQPIPSAGATGPYPSVKGSDLAGTLARHPIYNHLRHSRAGGNPGPHAPDQAALDSRLRGDDERGGGDDERGGDDAAGGDDVAREAALEFYARPRPFLPGDFVTTDSGTGLVHMSPDHGEDDFLLCREYGIEPVFAVMADGRYRDDWPWLGAGDVDADGKERRRSVINKPFNAPEGPICSDLRQAGALLAAADYAHSYPHSWRSKAKVIYRCTPQWFVPMDKDDTAPDGRTLRTTALAEIERVDFIPPKGRRRIESMVENRPDWVLSRQRAWGVPITLFVRADGSYLQDPAVNARVIEAIRQGGVDAWDADRKAEFLGSDHDPDAFEMARDILDVWFDSGCTHAFVLESDRWPALTWPANLYCEGSDQHRGWFQSSLLESCATRGRAPYDQVLTHGFTMASDGRKMSKSLGNTIDPLNIMEHYGADIIRLWALSVDYTEDHRIGDEILKGVADQYRKLRNTFRYLLGALDGFDHAAEGVAREAMPELEQYMLDRLSRLDATLRCAALAYDFNEYTRALIEFANEDLSAFFFDIRKDRLYCDAPGSAERRAYRTVLDIMFQALIRYAAPVLVFTAEEVWGTRFPDKGSIHLEQWHDLPTDWQDAALAERFAALRTLREDAMEAIEPLRREKAIRSGLEADVAVPAARVPDGFTDADLAQAFITASVTRTDSAGVTVSRTSEDKCGRCWRLLPSVAEDGALCDRCASVVVEIDAAGASACA